MEIRRPGADDIEALLAFFERIPAAERTFFKEAVLDRATVEAWATGGGRRALACEDGDVAGYVAVGPLTGWAGHGGGGGPGGGPGRRGEGGGRAPPRPAPLPA